MLSFISLSTIYRLEIRAKFQKFKFESMVIYHLFFFKSSRILRPLFLGGLILYYTNVDGTEVTLNQAYLYASGIVLTTLLPLFIFHPMQLFYFETSMKIKVACTSLIYEKILRMSVCTVSDGLNGQAVNLISNDVATFDYATCFLQELWVGPVEAGIMGYFIYREIGYSGLVGIVVMLAFIPLQGKKRNQCFSTN